MTGLLAAASPSAGEETAFWVVAGLAVLGALMMLVSRKAVHMEAPEPKDAADSE